jgi:hypothetical protein
MKATGWQPAATPPDYQDGTRIWVYSTNWGSPFVRPLLSDHFDYCHDASHWHPPSQTQPEPPELESRKARTRAR